MGRWLGLLTILATTLISLINHSYYHAESLLQYTLKSCDKRSFGRASIRPAWRSLATLRGGTSVAAEADELSAGVSKLNVGGDRLRLVDVFRKMEELDGKEVTDCRGSRF